MRIALPLIACVGLLLGATRALAQSDFLGGLTSNINITGAQTQYNPETGIATAEGDVNIKYQNVDITAGSAEYNTNTGDITCHHNVIIVKDGEIFRGENVVYNVKSCQLRANEIKSGLGPILYQSSDLKLKVGGEIDKIVGDQTYFTTHDDENPNYHVTAKDMTIYPGDRVIMHDVTLYAGDIPVLYLPLYVQPLDAELGYYFRPGYASEWGGFLLNQYGVMYGDSTLAKYMLDLRTERGIAGGVDLKAIKWKQNDQIGDLLIYVAHDTNPETDFGVEDRTNVPSSRYRISFHHRIYLPGPDESTWYLDFDINKLSDSYMLEDYFPNEFRAYPQPDNTVSLVHRGQSYLATLWGRFQVNNFFDTDSRLPELALDFTRQELGHTNIYYTSQNTIGYYRQNPSIDEQATIQQDIITQQAALANNVFPVPKLAGTVYTNNNIDVLRPQAATLLTTPDQVSQDILALNEELSQHFFRAYSYHEFSYPMTFGENNWFNVMPRIGGGLAYYGGVNGADVNGNPSTSSSVTRPIFHLGLDMSGKFSKVYDDVHSEALGIDEIRHIVQPYIDYSYLHIPYEEGLPAIDRLVATTVARPIDLPSFTAIDGLNSWDILRLGVSNILQTRRDVPDPTTPTDPNALPGSTSGNTLNWMGLNTFVDFFFQDPEHNRKMSDLYNNFFFVPFPKFRLDIDAQFPLSNSDYNFTEVNTNLTWMPTSNFRFSVGHQYIAHNPIFEDSSLFTTRLYWRINDDWGFEMYHIYEADAHQLQYQSYMIHRDLVSWTASFGALVRENLGAGNDYGLVFTLTLKDFPQVAIPLDYDPNPTGRGGYY